MYFITQTPLWLTIYKVHLDVHSKKIHLDEHLFLSINLDLHGCGYAIY